MAGLLESIFGSGPDDPRGVGMEGAIAGLLGRNLPAGLLTGSQNMRQMRQQQAEAAMKKQMFNMQLQQHQMQLDESRRANTQRGLLDAAARESYRSPMQAEAQSMGPAQNPGAWSPGSTTDTSVVPQVSPGFDTKGYTNRLFGINPMEAVKFQQLMAKDDTPISVAPGAVLWDKTTKKPIFTAPKEHNAPSAIQEYEFARSQGYAGTYEQWDTGRKKAGASRTDVRVENKTGDSLAKEIGPMLNESAGAAAGAVQQIDAANRVIKAVDTNKLYAGPLATTRLKVAQIAELVGANGKDDAEKIANTRSAVRGLAEMTLQGRKQMRGQGAITESESALAEKAISGNIDDLTAAEIKQLANASMRSAKFVYSQHQRKLDVVRGNPNLSQLAPFYDAPPMPTEPAPGNTAPTMRYNPQTGKLEAVR